VGAAETLGAFGAALSARASGRPLDRRLAEGIEALRQAIGGPSLDGLPPQQAELLAALARSTLAQAADLAAHPDRSPGWSHEDPAVLADQGTVSAALVDVLADGVVPELDGLAARVARPGAAFLDVGSGVGGICIAACRRWPLLHAVGIDPWPPVLELARLRVTEAGLAGAIVLRTQGIEELADVDAYDLAWVAAPFLPERALAAGLTRVAAALRPGGWALAGLYRGEGDVGAALAALRTIRAGGDPLQPAALLELLRRAGLEEVQLLAPEAWWSGQFVAGRRPVREVSA